MNTPKLIERLEQLADEAEAGNEADARLAVVLQAVLAAVSANGLGTLSHFVGLYLEEESARISAELQQLEELLVAL